MTRIRRYSFFVAVVIASIWTFGAAKAHAQDTSKSKAPTTKTEISSAQRDSVSLDDVQKAADQLAIAVQEAVRKATEDPAVKVAALKVAKNAVTAAQVVITQQAATLQTVLDALATEIAQATEKQQRKVKTH